MKLDTSFLETFCGSAMEEGRTLLQHTGLLKWTQSMQPDGRCVLRAKVKDGFNFVDHPRVEVDPDSGRILQFTCDCPPYRVNRGICGHCAALVLSASQTPIQSNAAVEMPAQLKLGPHSEETGVENFSYKYVNSAQDLYPGIAYPQIPLKIYRMVFPKARARSLCAAQGKWGGNCFGMVATAGLLQQNNEGTTVKHFNADATLPSHLALTDYNAGVDLNTLEFIELLHITQSTYGIQRVFQGPALGEKMPASLANAVRDFQNSKGGPVMMVVFGSFGGHAVLPYALQELTPTRERLHIYDPNWPMVTRFAELTKDEAGNYVGWSFAMSDTLRASSDKGDSMHMLRYDQYKAAWDNRKKESPACTFFANVGTVLKNPDGTVLARVTEDGVTSHREDISEIRMLQMGRPEWVQLSVPAGYYLCAREDDDQQPLSVRLTGDDLAIHVVTDAREALLNIDEANEIADVRILQPDSQYKIEILNTFGDEDEETVLEGVTGQFQLQLLQEKGQLYGRGLTEQTALRINEQPAPLSTIWILEETLQEEQTMLINTKSDPEETE